MAKLEHKNLFAYGDKAAVYETLQRDFNRDTYIQGFWHLVLFGAAAGATWIAGRPDWIWLFLGIYAAERALAKFVDNSNRNWAMHVMDWVDHGRNDSAT